MRTHRRLLLALPGLAVVALVVGMLAAPAGAGVGPRDRDQRDRRIAVGGTAVAADEVVDGPLVSIDGTATIEGTVDGSAIVVNGDLVLGSDGFVDGNVFVVSGDARIRGRVDGKVTVLSGRAILGSDAVVTDDVRSTDPPRVASGARVRGDVKEINVSGILTAIGIGFLVFWWIAVTVSTVVLGVILVAVFPRALEAAADVGRGGDTWWQAALVGLGLMVGFPIVGVLALSSIVGLPFGLGVLGALGLLHAVGYVTGAFFLGRLVLSSPKNRFGAFFVGWGILRVAAIVPLFGVLVWIVTSVYGVGMLAIVAFRAGRARVTEPPGESPGEAGATPPPVTGGAPSTEPAGAPEP